MRSYSKRKIFLISFIGIIFLGLVTPQNLKIPVVGATKNSYHPKSFWYYPWGKSVTHKGVDIFADKGTTIHSATFGLVISQGQIGSGGNYVLVLGPKWRLHYYAHLHEIRTGTFNLVGKEDIIGTVGTSGNAVGKPPHLHYAIFSIVPYFWLADSQIQGWKKMFYLNPINYF